MEKLQKSREQKKKQKKKNKQTNKQTKISKILVLPTISLIGLLTVILTVV
jgi:hypothetical protein